MLRACVDGICASVTARAVVFGLAYLVTAEVGHLLSRRGPEQRFAIFWPPAGLFLAVLVLNRVRSWPAFLVAALGANLTSEVLLQGRPATVGLGFYLANASEACLGAWLLRRFVGLPLALTRLRDVLGFAVVAALVGPLFGAVVGAGVATLAHGGSYALAWQRWWIADVVSVLVVAPVVLTWLADDHPHSPASRPWRVAEAVVLLVGVILTTEGVFGEWLPPRLMIPALVLPFLIWAGIRFPPRIAATTVLVAALIGISNASVGRGPFMALAHEPGELLIRAQTTLCILSLSLLALAATVAERKLAEQQKAALIGELEHALAEIKTLRGLIPLCAWCKNIRDDQGFWQRLEDYLCEHADVQLTHGICPACLDKQLAGLVGASSSSRSEVRSQKSE
jgi:integral membrane sensor domain MASE1